jgi:hypothetical protein
MFVSPLVNLYTHDIEAGLAFHPDGNLAESMAKSS